MKRMKKACALLGLAASLHLAAASPAGELTLVADGRAVATIYVKTGEPGPDSRYGWGGKDMAGVAAELASVLKKMTGADVPVAAVDSARRIGANAPAIVLGSLAAELGLKVAQASPAKDGFRYKASGKRLLIVGESPAGVYHGVYDLLERLGCGWYTPGPVGEVIPKRATVTLADDLDHAEASDSVHREYWGDGRWALKNKGHLRIGSWRHAWGHLVPKSLFATRPELFALNNGERRPRQLCTTNPQTIATAAEALLKMMDAQPQRTVFEAGPNDGGGLCECPNCRTLRTANCLEPSSGQEACSDLILKFVNDVAAITSRKHPDKYLGFYVYSEYSRVPVKVRQVHPNVFPMMAPIRRCRLHAPGSEVCPSSRLLLEEMRGWARMTDRLGFYLYSFNLADTLVPFSKIGYYKLFQKALHKLPIRLLAYTPETINSFAMHAPHQWLSQRFMWNSHIDIDAEMDRFFDGFYGAAAGPMKRYWLRIDRAYVTTPVHTGSQYGLHRIWTDELLAACRADVTEARRLARDERAAEAVAMAEAGLRCAELFIVIWKAVGRFDFPAAAAAQDELKAHIDRMAARKDPKWVIPKYGWGYYARFVGRTVSGGAKALAGGGRIVVKLPDVWRFRRDPKLVGAAEGWFRPNLDDLAWGELATFSRSWDDQGLGEYHADGWYRTRFALPAGAAGKLLRLWFGGFDHNVDVYLNGVHLGEKRGFATPAEYEAIAPHLRPGKENVLAVRVSAGGLAEIGTGGIMMPVMIYAPGTAAPERPKPAAGRGYEM